MPAPAPSFPDPLVLSRVFCHPESLSAADLPHVQASGHSGALYFALPPAHPLRPALRPFMLDLALRHAQVVAELRPLLAAWAAEGIVPLLFKGFALAQFEYAHPAQRFYGDVDLLLPPNPEQLWRAVHLAMAHGWRTDGQHADPARWTHETAHLFSPGGTVRLDVHRFVVALFGGVTPARAAALTAGLWQRASKHDWDGLHVWLPHPLDAAVLTLGLARSWGGDMGGVKPADYGDLRLLTGRYGLTKQALAAHAEHLGGAATWAAFSAKCNPDAGVLVLQPALSRPGIRQAAEQDGVHPRQTLARHRLRRLWQLAPLLPGALLDVAWANRAVRAGGDPRAHLRRVTPAGQERLLSSMQLELRLTAVRWLTRLFYPRQSRRGVCVPRAYASYRALRRAGHPAVFVSGVARRGGILGHAWVEDTRGTLELYGEPNNRRIFKVLFAYPEAPAP